jgi:uncharacterized protein YcbX
MLDKIQTFHRFLGADIRIYPVKSMREIPIKKSLHTKGGMDVDRLWMFADAKTLKSVAPSEYCISALKRKRVTLWLGYVQALGSSERGAERRISKRKNPPRR